MRKLLIPKEKYLASGLHIGTKSIAKKMKKFIYQKRKDGLAIFDLNKLDERIRVAAKFLAKKKILVVGRKEIAHNPVKKFSEIVKAEFAIGRYTPGMLTNVQLKSFSEIDVLLVTDPFSEKQAINDALKARIPIVAICDSGNDVRNIDLILPANNKGRKAIATIYWLLAREILKERGEIKSYREFDYKIEDFM